MLLVCVGLLALAGCAHGQERAPTQALQPKPAPTPAKPKPDGPASAAPSPAPTAPSPVPTPPPSPAPTAPSPAPTPVPTPVWGPRPGGGPGLTSAWCLDVCGEVLASPRRISSGRDMGPKPSFCAGAEAEDEHPLCGGASVIV